MELSIGKVIATYPCAGIGGSLVYSPSLVVLCEYFDKRRSLAIGIATSGESFGAIVVPHLMVILFDHYGFFGGLLILGAAMYNCCVSGALYRPIALNRQKPMTPSNLKNVSGVVFGSNDKDIPATETDSYAGAVTTSQKSSRLWETASTVGRVLDLAIWTDWRFSLFAASQTLAVTSFLPVLMLAPAVAEDGGMSQEQAASVISAIAAGDLVGHVISGVVFDLPSVRRVRYRPFSACMLVMALAIVWMPFITSIDVMLLCAVVFGFCVGIVIAHRTNILCDLLGTERISTGLGMMVCAQGVGTFVGPLLTGTRFAGMAQFYIQAPENASVYNTNKMVLLLLLGLFPSSGAGGMVPKIILPRCPVQYVLLPPPPPPHLQYMF